MADFIVTNGNDSGTGSLRQAILDANASLGADTITVTEDITLTSAINITDSVTIVGTGSTVITQTRSDRLFTINDNFNKFSDVTFKSINLTGGSAENFGGAIYSNENLTIVESNLFGNLSGYHGGAIYTEGAALTLKQTNISNNTAHDGGGISGYDSKVEISNSTIENNTAEYEGGGINLYRSLLKLVDSLVSENVAGYAAGGIEAYKNSKIEISNSTIERNIARYEGGGINLGDGSSLKLANSLVAENNTDYSGGGIEAYKNSKIEISNSTIEKNTSGYEGGGINLGDGSSLKLVNSLVAENNTDYSGGGIEAYKNSRIEISNSTIEKNTSGYEGGGINFGNGSSLKLVNSLVAENTTDYFGGGINLDDSSLKLTDSSIADNVSLYGYGGGIFAFDRSLLEISNSNISNNVASEGGGISSYRKTNVVTLIDSQVTNNVVDNISGEGITELVTLRIEAEDLTETTYRLEDNAIASGGQLLSLRGGEENEVGTASFDFTGVSGNYIVKIGTYDENDGEATIQLSQEGDLVGNIVLDKNPGGFAVSADTKVTRVAAVDLSIEQGDRFTITGLENASEHARIDFIEFEPVGSLPSIPSKPIRLEAEDADNIVNYRLEDNRYASGDEVLSLKGGNSDEVGSASFTFDQQGTYDISLGTFDENDGTASITLELNGSQIGETILLDEDLGRNLGDSYTAVSKEIASSISLEAGDVLTVRGFEEGGEFARLDYLEFKPVSSFEPIRLEAEDADSLINYRLEDNRYASGGGVLSLKGGNSNEVGSASFTFDEQGTYNIVVGTFDENDGTASITLELNGSQIGQTIVLDDDLGRNLGDSYTAVSKNIAFGISLEAGDVLTVNGFEEGGEFARLDYLEFIDVDSL